MNWKTKRGEKNPNAKLNLSQVREIRYRAERGAKSKDLAQEFGVARRTLSAIIHQEIWREDGSVYMSDRF